MHRSFEIYGRKDLGQLNQNLLIASFQHGVLESRFTWMSAEACLRASMPPIHAGMTKKVF
jgi:hypothetical protein